MGQLACPQCVATGHSPVGDIKQVSAVQLGLIVETDTEHFVGTWVCFFQNFLGDKKEEEDSCVGGRS